MFPNYKHCRNRADKRSKRYSSDNTSLEWDNLDLGITDLGNSATILCIIAAILISAIREVFSTIVIAQCSCHSNLVVSRKISE